MPAARVTPRVFLSKWWLIRFNKTDAALCRTRHFDKWCSHSSLHQAHSKALSTQVGILLKTSNMHPLPVQNKHKVFCDPYVSESFFLRRDFSNSDFLNPQLGWRRSEECGTGFVLLLPSSAGWMDTGLCQQHIHTMVILYLILFCQWEMSGQCTKQPLIVMK